MELFLPSLLIFLIVTIVVATIIPRFSPLIITLIAGVLLALGTYHHFNIFWSEYRLSTWQDQLKLFAPGILIAAIIVYLLFAIGSFFTGGEVPVPAIPTTELPPAETATNAVTAAINNAINTVGNVTGMNVGANRNKGNETERVNRERETEGEGEGILEQIGNTVTNAMNQVRNVVRENIPGLEKTTNQNKNKGNTNTITRSQLATI